MKPGDRLVCAFVRPVDVGQTFTEWPLHVTIMPWFRADISTEDLTKLFYERLKLAGPINAVARGREAVGFRGRKQANFLGPVAPFKGLATGVREVLHGLEAWLIDETTKRHQDFTPHVTVQANDALHEGEEFKCDTLYIVEQKGSHKEITASFPIQ